MSKHFFSWQFWVGLFLYFVLLCLYALWSYSLTDPNLILTSWSPYWNFQQWMWQTFFHNPQLLVQMYFGLIATIFTVYGWLIWQQRTWQISLVHIVLYGSLLLPLLFSYNALSHDVFNYIFNAKMVMVYQTDPHTDVALKYAHDDWTRFMHNTHTPAPYGYGWTILSLFPYAIGFGKFTLTWLIFRAWSTASIFLLGLSMWWLWRRMKETTSNSVTKEEHFWRDIAIVFLNPLFVIEVVSNFHNDLWMMWMAIVAVGLVLPHQKKNQLKWWHVVLSLLLLGFSISIKFATATLLPIWFFLVGYVWWSKWLPKLSKWTLEWWPTCAVLLIFPLLLTSRAQQFHPWYLTWLLVWYPFVKSDWLKKGLLVLSFSSLLRYIPWLLAGGFPAGVLFQQKQITWIPFILALVWLVGDKIFQSLRKK